MKTKKKFRSTVNLKIFMVLPLIAITFIALVSCSKTRKSEAELSVIAPSPSPPPVTVSDSVYVKVDELPVFKGGEKAILDYLAESTVYPAEAKKNGIIGKVLVKLVVQKDGSVSQVGIVKGVNPLLDAEAVRVVSTLPDFEKPGIYHGEAVSVHYVIPITFTLE